VWDIDEPAVNEKIAFFAGNSKAVTWSGTAERDIASTSRATKTGVLEAITDHLRCGYVLHGEYMKNGDLAYIMRCFLGPRRFYVKLKFVQLGDEERMHIFSAHPDR
jgi:hypothetical protein